MTLEEHEAILQQRLEEQRRNMNEIFSTILTGMASIIDTRDNSMGQHVIRTGKCVELFVSALRLDPDYDRTPEWWQNVTTAAPLHDLGKIAVPDAILQKQGRFTADEYDHMKAHAIEGARIGFEILSELPDKLFVEIATNIAWYHHERWNGQGYPSGLAGEEIPLEARIMALADVFDALVTKRSYKQSNSIAEAFGIIEQSLGVQFDPVLGRKFLALRPEITRLYLLLLAQED